MVIEGGGRHAATYSASGLEQREVSSVASVVSAFDGPGHQINSVINVQSTLIIYTYLAPIQIQIL